MQKYHTPDESIFPHVHPHGGGICCDGSSIAIYLASDADARIAELEKALKYLMRHYVGQLENARDRIVSLGGECDPVDVMERGDPHLRAVREVLGVKGTT
jgi:hypothetical protein